MRGQSKDKMSLKAKARLRTGHCCLCQHAGHWPKQITWPSPKSSAEEIYFVPVTIGTVNSYNKDGVQGVNNWDQWCNLPQCLNRAEQLWDGLKISPFFKH